MSGVDPYRAAAATGMRQAAGFAFGPASGRPEEIVATLADASARIGADGINLRLVAPERPTEALVEDIAQLGAEVLPALRTRLEAVL